MLTKRSVLCIPGRHWVMMEKLTQAPTYTECVQYTGSGKYKIYTAYIHTVVAIMNHYKCFPLPHMCNLDMIQRKTAM